MVFFSTRWTIRPEFRQDNTTLFASMTEDDIKAMYGSDITLIGSWVNFGTVSGLHIIDAPDVTAVNKYAVKWTLNGSADVVIKPIMHEDEFRCAILGVDKPPYYSAPIDLDSPLEEGESLYMINFKFNADAKGQVIQQIANVPEAKNKDPNARYRKLGNFFEAGGTGGMTIVAAKSPSDVLYTLRGPVAKIEFDIEPVMREETAFDIIRTMPDYEKNLAAVKAKMMAA